MPPLKFAPCFLCNFDEHTAPLQRCSRCKARCYCSETCQRNDWKEHKKECQSLADRGPSIHDPSDQDTIYYLKTSKPSIYDISCSGPFYPLDTILEQMRARLVAEESDSGYYYFEWLLEEVTVTGISNVRAVLPDGTMMTFEIIPERNPEVAVVMRSNPGQPKGIYKLLVTEHDPLLIEEGSVRVGGEDFPPVKQANVFGTFTTKGAANRAARELAEQWKREGYKTVTRSIEGRVTAGAAVGSSSTPILMCEVSRDDGGRTFEDGRVEY